MDIVLFTVVSTVIMMAPQIANRVHIAFFLQYLSLPLESEAETHYHYTLGLFKPLKWIHVDIQPTGISTETANQSDTETVFAAYCRTVLLETVMEINNLMREIRKLCTHKVFENSRGMTFKFQNQHNIASAFRHAIPVERATSREKGQPLCMSQYYRLFTSYRQPGKPRDCIYSKVKYEEGGENNGEENIMVACRNQVSSEMIWKLPSTHTQISTSVHQLLKYRAYARRS